MGNEERLGRYYILSAAGLFFSIRLGKERLRDGLNNKHIAQRRRCRAVFILYSFFSLLLPIFFFFFLVLFSSQRGEWHREALIRLLNFILFLTPFHPIFSSLIHFWLHGCMTLLLLLLTYYLLLLLWPRCEVLHDLSLLHNTRRYYYYYHQHYSVCFCNTASTGLCPHRWLR